MPSQHQPSEPWRGIITVTGMRSSDRTSSHDLHVAAVEIDGETHAIDWPPQFWAQMTHPERPILRSVQQWVAQYSPPRCTFVPDLLRDPHLNTANKATFRSLSEMLFESQTVAIAPWTDNKLLGGGIIIYPASNSSALLLGAVCVNTPFPDFLLQYPPQPPMPPSLMQQRPSHLPYQIPMSPTQYASSSRHGLNPHLSSPPNRMLVHPGTQMHPHEQQQQQQQQQHHQQQQPNRFIMPRPSYNPRSASSDSAWPAVKDEEDANNYTGFSPTHDSAHYPQ